MPDITLCTQPNCQLAEQCYRKQAKPASAWQSYAEFAPTLNEDEKHTCEYFLEVK